MYPCKVVSREINHSVNCMYYRRLFGDKWKISGVTIYHNTSENQLIWRKSPSLKISPMLYMHTLSHQKNWVRCHTKGVVSREINHSVNCMYYRRLFGAKWKISGVTCSLKYEGLHLSIFATICNTSP
jgi:hypothetical protein